MLPLRSLLVSLALVVAGCTTPGNPADWDSDRAVLAAAPVCCRSFADLAFQPVEIRRPLTADIDARSPVFEIAGEKSYVRAFQLPPTANILSLAVIAEALPKQSAAGDGMFYPGIVFLNESKEAVFTLPPSDAGYVDPIRLHAITLIGRKNRWKYFVVYTTPQALRDGMPVPTKVSQPMSTMIFVGGAFVPLSLGQMPPGRVYRGAPATPTARLTISIDEIPQPPSVN